MFVDHYPKPDYDIENELIAMLAAAVPGTRVRMSLYHLNRLAVADAIMMACLK